MKLHKNLFSRGTINKIVKKDKLEIMQKELDAVGGTKVFVFEVSTVEELFSAFALVIGFAIFMIFAAIINKSSAGAVFVFIIGLVLICYAQYRKPIDNYKESFMKDNELYGTMDTIISGLDAGEPLMYILQYISLHKKGNTAKLISECVARVNTGTDLNVALYDAAEKSFNHYFMRMALIIKKADTSVVGLSDQLRELQKDIEDERHNKKNERVEKIDNGLFFPILIGDFIPLILMIILPFFSEFQKISM
ncbi:MULTISPECIES: type II secretion system F family protein [Clostridium]|jgi:tight adherence protein C|uniref:type II secretion system F family protein n=1 Tax=Clostridium TaxID=1485 RepID=UPI00242F47F7|nr:type II secretion system F family protein [Clostridium tyrobutyricum]